MLGNYLCHLLPSNFVTIIHSFDDIYFSDSVFKLQKDMQRKQSVFNITGDV